MSEDQRSKISPTNSPVPLREAGFVEEFLGLRWRKYDKLTKQQASSDTS